MSLLREVIDMAEWPKRISIRGIAIEISSWEEMDEVIERYGSNDIVVKADTAEGRPSRGSKDLGHSERALLRMFV